MKKVHSVEELKNIRDELLKKKSSDEEIVQSGNTVNIRVAMATCGIASGARTIMDYLKDELEKRNIQGIVTQTGCMGYCYAEPTIEVTLAKHEPIVFGWVDEKKADVIIEKFIKSGEFVEGIIPRNYSTIQSHRRTYNE